MEWTFDILQTCKLGDSFASQMADMASYQLVDVKSLDTGLIYFYHRRLINALVLDQNSGMRFI